MQNQEQIVFVQEDGTPTGEVGPKLESHTATTQLHLAFSCYILRRSDNRFLLTRRALKKKVWPGVWTNSVCGHPMPGEAVEDAIRRRTLYELGIHDLSDVRCILPRYRYTTPPYNDIIENEFCPVYVAYTDEDPQSNSDEVEDFEWIEWSEYATRLHNDADNMSYWAKDQYLRLKDSEPFASMIVTI